MSPKFLLRTTKKILPWSISTTIVLSIVGVFFALIASPPDYQQGEAVRIMYVHVPSAWMSLALYTSMGIAAFLALVWKNPLANLYSKAAAPIGTLFTVLCLITGSIWGTPMWGTWWVWDARLTSVLVLLFFYLAYILLSSAFDDLQRSNYTANILLLIGTINLPIIKFSVDWWHTLHQPASILRLDGPSIHPSMLLPLFLMTLTFLAYTLTLLSLRVQTQLLTYRIRFLQYHKLSSKNLFSSSSLLVDAPSSRPTPSDSSESL